MSKRRASEDDIEELAELWNVDPDDVRDLARQWRVSVLDLETEAARRAEVTTARELREEDRDEPDAVASDSYDEEDLEEYAALWGVEPGDVEDLAELLDEAPDEMTRDELRDYIDDLYDVLTDEGFDLDVSDLWDMYYGYAPGSKAA